MYQFIANLIKSQNPFNKHFSCEVRPQSVMKNSYNDDYYIYPIARARLIYDLPHTPWNWDEIRKDSVLMAELLKLDFKSHKLSELYEVSKTPTLAMEMKIDNPNKPWNWNAISYNNHLTMEMIIANPDKPWNYAELKDCVNLPPC